MLEIVLKISTIFVMILIGYATGRLKIIAHEAQKHLIDLLLKITIPCLLFYSIACNEIANYSPGDSVKMLGYSVIYFIAAATAAAGLVKVFSIKGSNDTGVYEVIFTSVNAGFIGFPVCKILYDDNVLYFMVLHNLVMNVYMYSLGIFQLRKGEGQRETVKRVAKALLNPCIIGALLGMGFLFTGIGVPDYAENILQPIGDVSIPVSMIVIGLQLSDGKATDCFADKVLVVFSAVKMFVWPVLVFFVVWTLPLPKVMQIVLAVGAAFPPAATISALAADEEKNYKLAADGLVITTLFSMISIAGMAVLIGNVL